jgi:hypothetical protein
MIHFIPAFNTPGSCCVYRKQTTRRYSQKRTFNKISLSCEKRFSTSVYACSEGPFSLIETAISDIFQ